MSASIIASFISFLITGIYTYWIVSFNLTIHPSIKWSLFFAILANAFYFFYIEALTESDEQIKDRLHKKGRREWILRIISQTILFSLWFLLSWNLLAFSIGLVLLYILYIYWDRYTKEYKNDKNLYKTDIAGLILTSAFLIITYIGMNGNITNHKQVEFSKKICSQDSVRVSVHFTAKDSAVFCKSFTAKDSVDVIAQILVKPSESDIGQGSIMKPLVSSSVQFFWGGCVFLYLLLPIVSLIMNKFKLFQPEYWQRNKII
jgi:hypothetical protein